MSKRVKIGILAHRENDMIGVGANYVNYFRTLFEGNVDVCVIEPYNLQVDTSIDVLVLTGGPDVSPEMYREIPLYTTSRPRVETEFFAKTTFYKYKAAGIPVIGICMGMQLLNVLYGGKLVQHIPAIFNHPQSTDREPLAHHVDFMELPFFNNKTNPEVDWYYQVNSEGKHEYYFSIPVTSYHHQCVLIEDIKTDPNNYKYYGKLSRDMEAIGFAVELDKNEKPVHTHELVEAIYSEGKGVLGVQYHPEKNNCKVTRKVFEKFITYHAKKTETPIETSESSSVAKPEVQ